MLKHYAALLAQSLPPQGAVLLSDDPRRLFLLQAYCRPKRQGQGLPVPGHRLAAMARLSPVPEEEVSRNSGKAIRRRTSRSAPNHSADPVDLRLAQTNSLYYLHPSFGYYFEFFYPEPHGLAYKLNPFPTNALFAPPPDQRTGCRERSLLGKGGRTSAPAAAGGHRAARIRQEAGTDGSVWPRKRISTREPNRDAAMLAAFYSRALDYWGVEAQNAGG